MAAGAPPYPPHAVIVDDDEALISIDDVTVEEGDADTTDAVVAARRPAGGTRGHGLHPGAAPGVALRWRGERQLRRRAGAAIAARAYRGDR